MGSEISLLRPVRISVPAVCEAQGTQEGEGANSRCLRKLGTMADDEMQQGQIQVRLSLSVRKPPSTSALDALQGPHPCRAVTLLPSF